MRPRLRVLLIVFAVILLASVTFLFNHVNQTIRNSYAVWWVADMVITHMDANNGQWPENWDDLHDDYEACVKQSGRAWQFDELKRRVEIDWDADPNELLADQTDGIPNFRVIWLSDGTNSYWSRREPNKIILEYLATKIAE